MVRVICLSLLAIIPALAQPFVYRVNTVAGTFDLGNGGPAAQAILGRARYILHDPQGALYVSEAGTHMVRRIERDGRIVAIAGSIVRGNSGDGGPATQATLNGPGGLALDGNVLYIADDGNNRVRAVNLQTGIIENYAGSSEGRSGFAGDGGPSGNALFFSIGGLAIDNQGNLLIADYIDARVRRVNKRTGVITTFAGNGDYGFGVITDGSQATASPLTAPDGLAVDTDGSVYIADGVGIIVKVDANGTVRRIGGGTRNLSFADGIQATEAAMRFPTGLALNRERRRLYVSDYILATVREINLDNGLIFNIAGNATAPYGFSGDGGVAKSAILGGPWGLSLDARGQLAIADVDNHRIRLVNTDSIINTIAGRPPYGGDGGPALQATMFQPANAIPDGDGGLFIADTGNCVIRRVNRAGVISRFAGRVGVCQAPTQSQGDTQLATAVIASPKALARDRAGNVYVAESTRVLKVDPAASSVTVLARSLRGAFSLALDNAQTFLYVSETTGHRITRINLADGSAQVFAGSAGGTFGFAGDGGSIPADARFNAPSDIAFDSQNNLYIADSFNARIRRIDPTGRVATVAGTGSTEVGEGPANTTAIGIPTGLTVDAQGNLYYTAFQRIWKVSRNRVEFVAGGPGGFAGDGGFGSQARFNVPATIRADGTNLIVTDSLNHRIRTITPLRVTTLSVLSGDGQSAGTGTLMRDPLVVIARLADGTPAPGVPVTFAASSGTLSATRAVTGTDGRASVTITMPAQTGAVTVTAAVEDLPSVRFALTATQVIAPSPSRPRISAVITAGSFGAATRIAPGTWMEIYGANFAPNLRQWSGDDFRGNQAPTELAGVRVSVGGRAAFIQLVAPTQINAQVPDGIANGPVLVTVTNAEGTSESFTVAAAPRAPALLSPPAFLVGGKQYVAAIHGDGAFVGPAGLIAGAAFRPAKAGDRVVLYGVGFGAVSPGVPAGQITAGANALANLTVTIGGRNATIEYGGLAGGFVGLYQFNLVIPDGVAAGDASLSASVDGTTLEQTLVITVE